MTWQILGIFPCILILFKFDRVFQELTKNDQPLVPGAEQFCLDEIVGVA